MWLLRVAASVAVPAAFLALLESGLSVAGFGRPMRFFVETEEQGFVQTNQFFGRRFFPASIARTPDVERFRATKGPNVYRIFVLGGSAAMGFPEPAFGVGRVLESLLREEYEGFEFEIINAAMTAVNSHVVLPIARECVLYEPDALVLYLGNNEVVGPYGPSSVFGDPGAPLPLIRGAIGLRATRTGQLLQQIAALGSAGAAPSEWRGMAMFLENQIPWGDARLERVYRHFRSNLEDICLAGRNAGARVVLSTVAVNVADNAPFASRRPEEDGTTLREWEEAYQEGITHQSHERYGRAVESFERAAAVYGGAADLAYRHGQCLREVGRAEESRSRFEQARDLDTLRFRADSRLNAIVREAAAEAGEEGLTLVDAEKIFQDASRDGIPGAEWFYEHVHLRFSGNYMLARAIADSLHEDLERKGARRTGQPANEETIAERMALTRWDRYRMWRDIAGLMEQPPFPNQLDYENSRAAVSGRLQELLGNHTLLERKAAATAAYDQAVERAPGDRHLRRRFAELLDAASRPREAAEQWRILLDALPDNLYWRTSLGASLREAGQLEEASQAFQAVLAADHQNAAGHFGLGSVLQKQEKFDEAVERYEQALRFRPGYAEAANNLGLIAMKGKQAMQALAHFERAIQIRPAFPEALENLGVARLQLSQTEAAQEAFRRAIEIAPDSASARYHLGASLAAAGRFGEALPVLTDAVRLDPASAESHHALAAVLAAEKRIDEAMYHLDEAIRLEPSFAEALYNRGLLLARQGRFQAAVSSYREALEVRPEYPEAWNNMGTALARQGDPQQAENCFEQALRLRPDFEDARRNLANLRSGQSPR